jgi:hypothetical protein
MVDVFSKQNKNNTALYCLPLSMRLLTLVICISLSCVVRAQVNDKLGVKGPIKYNNTLFHLSFADKSNGNYYVQEYLPAGDKVESFHNMMSIFLLVDTLSVRNAVKAKADELEKRKKEDPVCRYELNESPDGKEIMVDFVLAQAKGDKVAVVEFNIYRYKQIILADGKKALIIYAYSKRGYSDGITAFFDDLKENRIRYLNGMITADMPDIKQLN